MYPRTLIAGCLLAAGVLRQSLFLYMLEATLFPVQAIPFQMLKKILPINFKETGDALHLTTPMGEGYNSDMFCKQLFQKWWTLYRVLRAQKRVQHKSPADKLLRNAFTDYVDTVPVESFGAEALRPFSINSWRAEHWSCYTACQDLRTTIEWILSIAAEDKQHVRALARLAFICEEGLISKIYEGPSIREYESASAVQAALALLPTYAPRLTDTIRIEGETGMLQKCKCYKPNEDELAFAKLHTRAIYTRGSIHTRHRGNGKRPIDENTEVPTRSQRPRIEITPLATEIPVSPLQSEVPDDNTEFEFRIEDLTELHMFEPITCYDFDYPDIGFGMPGVFPNQNVPYEIDQDVQAATQLVQALLSSLDRQNLRHDGSDASSSGSGSKHLSAIEAPDHRYTLGYRLHHVFTKCRLSDTTSTSFVEHIHNLESKICGAKMVHCSLLFSLLYSVGQLSVLHAIPLSIAINVQPKGFKESGEILHLTRPVSDGIDSDIFCQHLLHLWWTKFRATRKSKMTQEDGSTPVDPRLRQPFTDYPDSVPVESFGAEALKPFTTTGSWRTGYFDCLTACQDIRTTIEWVLGILVENKQQVRAKARLGFICERDLVAMTYDGPSRREYESESATETALASLSTLAPKLTDPVRIYGETGILKKCKCVRPTASEREVANRLAQNGPADDGVNIRTTRAKLLADRKRAQDSKKANKKSKVSEPEPASSQSAQETILDEALDISFDYRIESLQDLGLLDPSTCYDYEYPELDFESFMLPPVKRQYIQDPPETDVQEATNFLQAALVGFTETEHVYSNREEASSSSSHFPGNRKSDR